MTPPVSAEHGLIVAGCSRRKKPAPAPIPALDLYEGGCIPGLRDRLGDNVQLRQRIRIVSALYGLLHADSPIMPYDRRLTDVADADVLRQRVAPHLDGELAAVTHVLAVVEPLYLLALEPVVQRLDSIRLYWIAAPRDWQRAATVLDTWGWT
ncbi:DUF6884 domain-containing protein [Sciscionella marina]|uniref:DUF6884 domain-containing protein n=1 Tax=Sciscionella marina TaxID=508770 RepID=UPI00058E3E00|nr:DUF6884 domain-containing protein [Sciscionella marina]